MEKHFIQNFEYPKNKFYSSIEVDNPFSTTDNVQIWKLINNLDQLLIALTEGSTIGSHKKFMSLGKNFINELHDILNERSRNDPELNQTLLIIFSETIKLTERYINNVTLNKDFKSRHSASPSPTNFQQQVSLLKEQGYLEFEFEQSPEFIAWSNNQLAAARKQYENESDWRGANSYESSSNEFKLIENFIRKNEIVEIISEYKQMNMCVYYAAWDYAHNRQKWFRNNHEYNYLNPTNYYHFDSNEDISKMLIYLTDVTENDGPFRFVKGSNKMPRLIFLTLIHYAIDSIISPKYGKKENLYGRGLFLYRKDLLMKFPISFMGTTHFGDDIIEDSSLSKYLLDNTVTFKKKRGTAILFDGFRGIHAGGNATKGERLAVQVAFMRKKSFPPPPSFTHRLMNEYKKISNIGKSKIKKILKKITNY